MAAYRSRNIPESGGKGAPDKTANKKKKRKARGRGMPAAAVGIALLLILVCAYAGAAVCFTRYFPPQTKLMGEDVSLMTAEQAKAAVDRELDSYKLTLLEQDGASEVIDGGEIGLSVKFTDAFYSSQSIVNTLKWPLLLVRGNEFSPNDGTLSVVYDDELLSDKIASLKCMTPDEPVEVKDAQLTVEDGKYVISPERMGNTVHKDELAKKVREAVDAQNDSLDLVKERLYDMPEVYSDDAQLQARFKAYSRLNGLSVTLGFGEKKEVLNVSSVSDWLEEKKNEDGTYSVSFKDEKIKEFAASLSEKYDTFGKPIVLEKHSGGKAEITTGDYGWILDQDYAEQKLREYLDKCGTVDIDLTDDSDESNEWWYRKVNRLEDVGSEYYKDAYIEVSISEQHMWMYKGGKQVFDSDVVTGNPNLKNDTPKGAFRIRSHESPSILRGADYTTPVSYWICFAYEVGFHDATWQPYFGGTLYQINGSHGCVNMPLDKVAKLYDMIFDGMPVFVY